MAVVPNEASTELAGPFRSPRADPGRRARATDTVIIVVAVIAGLSYGRQVLVPIALAVLLSFVLAPVVRALERLRIGRVASVLAAVVVSVGVLVGLGAIIGKQVAQLTDNLPQYQLVISKKWEAVRNSDIGKGVVEKAADALQGLKGKLKPAQTTAPSPVNTAPAAPDQHLLPVEVHEPAPSPVQILQSILAALLPPLANAAIVIIFVIFILLQRGDLRDRFIGMTGAHDLNLTTKALDEAATRLGSYFLALTGINAAFGLGISAGLAFIGVPNPILWGIVGAVLRFVPYIGAFIAAAFPLALAAAVDPGWSMVVETALLFGLLETLMGQVVEPQLFGHTTGMSPLAIIIAAAFWTLIWGPPGLLLSTPITACLVVLGRHVENLNFIELLLGDKPALSPAQSFYQRILASDPDEVAFQAEVFLNEKSLLDYYEEVAMPGLAIAQVDVSRGALDIERQIEVCACVERVVDDLADHVAPASPATQESKGDQSAIAAPPAAEPSGSHLVLCLAGLTPLDQAACAIATQLLDREGLSATFQGPAASGGLFGLDARNIGVICIFYLDHRSTASIRYTVRRLRRKFPSVTVAVCLWGNADLTAMAESAQADATINTLREAVTFCVDHNGSSKTASRARPLSEEKLFAE